MNVVFNLKMNTKVGVQTWQFTIESACFNNPELKLKCHQQRTVLKTIVMWRQHLDRYLKIILMQIYEKISKQRKMKQLGNPCKQRSKAISNVEEKTIWEGIEYIKKLPKLEKRLPNTIFEWVDWGTGEIFKLVTSSEAIVIEDKECQKIMFENLNLPFMPTLESCKEMFYNKMTHKVNIWKIVSLVDLPGKHQILKKYFMIEQILFQLICSKSLRLLLLWKPRH